MNAIYRSIWNAQAGTFVAVSENARGAGKAASSGATSTTGAAARLALTALVTSLALAFAPAAQAQQPIGGVVTAGSATIDSAANGMTITQTSQNVAINWQSFSIGAGDSVRFVQPDSSSVALNRVVGADPSRIMGNLSSNGKVFLVNPNGVLFGKGASVNVGALVASTGNISDADFMAGRYTFSGAGDGAVRNEGTLQVADGGYVALLAREVSNDGSISAPSGTVALAGGNAFTLDVLGDSLLGVSVDQGALQALASNGGLIQADGGQVLLTTQGAGSLLHTAVNNTGVIRAQRLENQGGVIKLLGDMESGTANVSGTLDASARAGGDGGFIETSAATVKVASDARISTSAQQGLTGTWLIDPQDFIIGGGATDNISGATLSALLVTNSVTITTAPGSQVTTAGTPPLTNIGTGSEGNGDIFVNQAVSWTASSSPTTLTLNAVRDININQPISATNGNLVACCGRDINVNAAVTTVNGSVLLGAGRNLNLLAALTTTDGNLMMCAGNDLNINDKITLTRGSSIPAQSLGLPLGLVLSAGTDGSGAGTVNFSPLAPPVTVTGPNAPALVIYNPVSYTAPTDYLPKFTLTGGSTLTQKMLVFAAGADKTFDGSTSATLTSLRGNPVGVTLIAGPGSTASFDTADVGLGKTVSFTGYSLGGPAAGSYALPVSCCGVIAGKTRANITAVAVLPPVVPPVVVAPPVVVVPPIVGAPPIAVPPAVVIVPPTELASFVIPAPVFGPRVVVAPQPGVVPPIQVLAALDDAPPVFVLPPPPVEVAPPVIVPPPVAELPDTYVPPNRPVKADRN